MLTKKDIEQICTAGGLAPSGANIQPWKVEVYPKTIKVMLDAYRSSTFADVNQYASILSIGSFIENASIASSSLGLTHSVHCHEIKDPGLPLAHINYIKREPVANPHELSPYIPLRCTNREPYDGTTLSIKTIKKLEQIIAHRKICHFYSIHSSEAKKIAGNIIGQADALRMKNPILLKELFEEIRWTKKETRHKRDGIDIETLSLAKSAQRFLHLLNMNQRIALLLPAQVYKGFSLPTIKACSHLCLISLKSSPSTVSLLQAGMDVQRLWLKATALGLSVQPMSVLPFFILRVHARKGEGFTSKELNTITCLERDLRSCFGIVPSDIPLFIFRLFKANRPENKSIRLNWKEYTKVHTATEK